MVIQGSKQHIKSEKFIAADETRCSAKLQFQPESPLEEIKFDMKSKYIQNCIKNIYKHMYRLTHSFIETAFGDKKKSFSIVV